MKRFLPLPALLAFCCCPGGAALSGIVVDRAGNGLSGVGVSLDFAGGTAKTDANGLWSLASTGIDARPISRLFLRWNGRSVDLALSEPSTVSLDVYDQQGASLGRLPSIRLGIGSHFLPLSLTSTGMVWLRVAVNGQVETVLAGPSVFAGGGNVLVRPIAGARSLQPQAAMSARSQGVVDTLRFTWKSRTVALVPLANQDTSGIVVNIGADSSIVWNDSIAYGSLYDDRDGQVYRAVRIGSQVWMAENLNFEVDSSWCPDGYVDAKVRYCDTFGRLYQWTASMDLDPKYNLMEWAGSTVPHRGICPNGWHVPSGSEWQTLLLKVDSNPLVPRFHGGAALMSKEGWQVLGDSIVGPDSLGMGVYSGFDLFGFRILPAGDRYWDGRFFERLGNQARFWTSSERGALDARYLMQTFGYGSMGTMAYLKSHGFSLRCMRD